MPKRPIVWGLLASFAAAQGLPAEAQQYRRATSRQTQSTQARPKFQDFAPGPALARQEAIDPAREKTKNQAQDAYKKADYKRAIALVDPIVRTDPKDAVALYIRGSARIDLGLRDQDADMVRAGIADARSAVTHGATEDSGAVYYVPYLHGMLSLAKMEGRKDHAQIVVDVADQVLELKDVKASEKANLHFQRAGAYVFLEKFDDAAKAYQSAIEVDNSHIGAYVALADAHAKGGNHEAAREAYDTAVEAFSNSPLIHNNRGSYLRSQGDLKGAAADFKQAVDLDSEFVVGWINHGYTLLQLGDAVAAEKSFDKAIKLDPSRTNVYGLRGQARMSQGKLQPGIADHEMVTRQMPKYADGHANLGFARFYNGEYAGALEAFDAAVEVNPGMKYLDTWRMLSLVALGKTDDLMTRFEDTLKKEADKRDWVDQMLVYLADGQTADELLAAVATDVPEDADDEAKQAIANRTDQQTCEAHYVIGRKLLAAGDKEAANEHFQKVLATDAKYLAAYRGAQFQLGKFAVAEKKTSGLN